MTDVLFRDLDASVYVCTVFFSLVGWLAMLYPTRECFLRLIMIKHHSLEFNDYKGEKMGKKLVNSVILNKKYKLSEIYDLVENYCAKNNISDWKHKLRAMLEERNGIRKIGNLKILYYGNGTYEFVEGAL